ncbi:TPA: DNA-binding response regulator [Pseudomonas aeruginosa]|nr:DNA-binding response regulator [Pseudomonas aeruginosa]
MSELLLIDDDRELCELLGTWLVQEGFSVRASHDGAQARRALAEQTPDAVVLDVMLPDGSGLELLKQLRGEPLDKQALAQLALGRKLTLYDRSLDMHVSNLRKKLGSHPDGSPRILALRGRGYYYSH